MSSDAKFLLFLAALLLVFCGLVLLLEYLSYQ